jgi:aspartyl-tRNA(Asn)/glutamyl-tRNA(Gln) amidotransferase subunit C
MFLDESTVARIATLARLRLTDGEREKMVHELGGLLAWVEQLNEVNVDGVEPMTSVVGAKPVLRADKVTDGDKREAVLANAPEASEGFFVVPKVVE